MAKVQNFKQLVFDLNWFYLCFQQIFCLFADIVNQQIDGTADLYRSRICNEFDILPIRVPGSGLIASRFLFALKKRCIKFRLQISLIG